MDDKAYEPGTEEFITRITTMIRNHLTYERIALNTPEPPEGSVVLRDGLTGTAYQRHYSDGKWHATSGQVEEWSYFTGRADPKMTGDFIIFVPEHEAVD